MIPLAPHGAYLKVAVDSASRLLLLPFSLGLLWSARRRELARKGLGQESELLLQVEIAICAVRAAAGLERDEGRSAGPTGGRAARGEWSEPP